MDAEDLDEDTVMMDALEAGADDMQADDDVFEIYHRVPTPSTM